jgi:L-asparaginase/Glu-tRNA(Gln) amidotransferase subunit D
MTKLQNNNKKRGLHVIVLGGTIDFESNAFLEIESKGFDMMVPRKHSIVPKFLNERIAYSYGHVHFSRVDIVDSRNITEKHKIKLIEKIEKSPFDHILVTMGTKNIHKIRNLIETKTSHLKDKVIGLVGSRQPLSNYQSDAGFNLGFTIGKLQTLKPGVYSFHPDKIRQSVIKTLKNVVFVITGGTIESYYDPGAGHESPYQKSIIPDYFKKALGIVPDEPNFVFREVSMKDSRNLTQEDFSRLTAESIKNKYKKQIIVAGTYGIPDLSRRYKYMMGKELIPKNAYVFTGSMLPEDTYLNDGWYNLGYVIGKIEILEDNSLVSMHSWITPSSNVWKQLNEGRFLIHDEELTM